MRSNCDLIFTAICYLIQTNYVIDFVEAKKDNNLNAPKSSEDKSLKEKDVVELSEKAEVKLSYQRCHSDNFYEPNIKPDFQKSLADIQTSMTGQTSEMKIKLFKNNSLHFFTSVLIKTTFNTLCDNICNIYKAIVCFSCLLMSLESIIYFLQPQGMSQRMKVRKKTNWTRKPRAATLMKHGKVCAFVHTTYASVCVYTCFSNTQYVTIS